MDIEMIFPILTACVRPCENELMEHYWVSGVFEGFVSIEELMVLNQVKCFRKIMKRYAYSIKGLSTGINILTSMCVIEMPG